MFMVKSAVEGSRPFCVDADRILSFLTQLSHGFVKGHFMFYVPAHLWTFSSFPLICLIDSDANITFLITCPEARDCESFNFVHFQNCLSIIRTLYFLGNFRISSLIAAFYR